MQPRDRAPAVRNVPGGHISLRSVITGALLCVIIGAFFTYSRVVMLKTGMSSDFITAGAIYLFFLLTLFLNPLLRLVRRRWAFDRTELVVVYTMLIIASTIPTWGFVANLVPMLPAPYYFATAENNWAESIHPLIPDWMMVRDPTAVRDFYEGLPEGAHMAWDVWLPPILAWCALLLAIWLMMIACMVLVRRQWVEHERLAFPLVQLPVEMAETSRAVLGPFFRSPVMWAGFALAFSVMSLSGLHYYFPGVPEPELTAIARLWRGQTAMLFSFIFSVLGLSYLLPLHVANSFWLFHVLAKLQMAGQNMIGYRLEGEIERFMEGTLMVAHQGMGAMVVLVAFGAWVSRSHLRQIWHKVTKGSGLDDDEEVLSYRAAAAILIICGLFATLWLNLSGLPLIHAFLFLAVTFAIFIFMARLVAEGGLGFMQPQMTAQTILINFAGTASVTQSGIFSLALTFSWAGSIRVLLMASAINAMKMAQGVGALRRPLFWVMVAAILVTLVSSFWLILWAAHDHGAVNLEPWFFTANARNTIDFVAYKINNPVSFSTTPEIVWPRALWAAVGGAVMAGLIFARHHWLWWPLHPLGFAGSASNIVTRAWFSIFLGALIKAIVLKYGGVRLYLAVRPFFLGMVMGQLSAAGVWLVIDLIFGGTGNNVPVFDSRY